MSEERAVTAGPAGSGLCFDHPAAWETTADVAGCDLMAVAPGDAGAERFRANLILAVTELDEPATVDDFAAGQRRLIARFLTDSRLIDRSPATLLDQPAERVLVTYRQGVHDLVTEQWWTVTGDGRQAVVLSGVCAGLDYDGCADVFSAAAASLRLAEGAPPGTAGNGP